MISSRYDPGPVEQKWYARWQKEKLFEASLSSKKPSYCVLMPPPNITGYLHMGHVLNNTLQDVLIRRKRMQGYSSCWVPGIDHASIATEAKVVAQLKTKGVDKRSLGREEFLREAWKWKEEYGGIILRQLEQLGASCDWQRSCFTMDEARSESVLQVFVKLHEEGYIYRGKRMVNWDPEARTALSEEEVHYKEVDGTLFYIAYPLEEEGEVVVATTRPETLLGDTALCVHPEDLRFSHLHGKKARLPLLGRILPIVADKQVDPEFGTGCLKITPAHDTNDYLISERHNLEAINILDERGCLNENAKLLVGEERFTARRKIVDLLEEKGYLRDKRAIRHKVGFSERTQVVVEPRLSLQWFCRMKLLAKPALEAVMNDTIRFYPNYQKNTYRYWMENIRDWCISRQLWWGHRIPVWYMDSSQTKYVLGRSQEEAYEACKRAGYSCRPEELQQEEDVLDTWFSSWLWPLSVFDGLRLPKSKEMSYFYPTQDLVTGPDILFFWVARMIMAGYAFSDSPPFRRVYFTGLVRDKARRKMSKSLGNSPEPIDLIQKYGADSLRMGMMMCGRAGGDILFDESLCVQGRNFANKLWNAHRLIKGWKPQSTSPSNVEKIASRCFSAQLQSLIHENESNYEAFRISDTALSLYKFVRESFCNTYLELIKPKSSEHISEATMDKVLTFFEQLLSLLHPFMPFITEEIWQQLRPRLADKYLVVERYPEKKPYEEELCKDMQHLGSLAQALREKLSAQPKTTHSKVSLYVFAKRAHFYTLYATFIEKLTGLSPSVVQRREELPSGTEFLVSTDNFVLTGLEVATKARKHIDKVETEKKIVHLQDFLQKILVKLKNEKFITKAPEAVISKEKSKYRDALTKLRFYSMKLESELTETKKLKAYIREKENIAKSIGISIKEGT